MSESLYLEESLEAIVKTTMEAVGATGAALVLEDGKIAWPGGRAGRLQRAARLCAGSGARSASSSATATRRSRPRSGPCSASIAHHAAVALEHGRAVMRGVLAQEIHHRVKNNLQTVASLLRLQARADGVDPRKALDDSVNRILAIAAVHEVLTERRDDDVELDDLLERLRATIVQGLGAGKTVEAQLESVSLAGSRATALALVFSELLQNALEHGGHAVRVELARRNGEVVLAIADDGSGIERRAALGHGSLDRPRARPRRARRDARPDLERRRPARTGHVPGLAGQAARGGGERASGRRRLVHDRRRVAVRHRPRDEACGGEVLERERQRAWARFRKGGPELREPSRPLELGQHRERPLLQRDLLVPARGCERRRGLPGRSRARAG